MKESILLFLFRYSGYILLIVLATIYLGYFGIYSLLGNKVIIKTSGFVLLSKEASISNIIYGIGAIVYIVYILYTKELK